MRQPLQLDLFPSEVHLSRIDPAKNMRRFYAMAIEPNLFGKWCVMRRWGRIGTYGQQMTDWFDDPGRAHDTLSRMERLKRRRGYR